MDWKKFYEMILAFYSTKSPREFELIVTPSERPSFFDRLIHMDNDNGNMLFPYKLPDNANNEELKAYSEYVLGLVGEDLSFFEK